MSDTKNRESQTIFCSLLQENEKQKLHVQNFNKVSAGFKLIDEFYIRSEVGKKAFLSGFAQNTQKHLEVTLMLTVNTNNIQDLII